MKKTLLMMTMLFLVVLAMQSKRAGAIIIYDDGGVHTIDSFIGDGVEVYDSTTGDFTTVNVVSGGLIKAPLTGYGYLAGYDNSRIKLDGGRVENNLVGWDNAQIEVSGGEVGDHVIAYDDSYLDLSGGSALGALVLIGDSTATLSGTTIGTALQLENNSHLTIWGSNFAIDGVSVGYGDIINTGEYVEPFYGVTYSMGTLTGILDNGNIINNTYRIYQNSYMTLIPEPATLSLLLFGGVMLRRFNR